jgi:hypothetical protein
LKTSYLIAGAVYAFAGGLLLIFSGYRTSSFLLSVLSIAQQQSIVPADIKTILGIAGPILSAIISLGGLLVLAGGGLLIAKHKSTASILIALGGGFGFLGIVIALGYAVYSSGLSTIITHTDYWIGVLIASIAREIGKRA